MKINYLFALVIIVLIVLAIFFLSGTASGKSSCPCPSTYYSSTPDCTEWKYYCTAVEVKRSRQCDGVWEYETVSKKGDNDYCSKRREGCTSGWLGCSMCTYNDFDCDYDYECGYDLVCVDSAGCCNSGESWDFYRQKCVSGTDGPSGKDYLSCYNNDVYWYEDGVRGEKYQECGNDYCESWESWYCTGSGSRERSRICHDKGCSGGSCYDYTWYDYQRESCGSGYTCQSGVCVYGGGGGTDGNIECWSNADCGSSGWAGSQYCSNDDVYQSMRTYTCHNPGTTNSYCTHTDTYNLKIDCGEDTCDSWGSWYCSGTAQRKRDMTCYDRGCSAGICLYNIFTESEMENCQPGYVCQSGQCIEAGLIECYSDTDCGTDGWTGSPYCTGNDVYQEWRTYICSNPSTTASSCSYTDSARLKQSCPTGYTCQNGQCLAGIIQCWSDDDCGTPNWFGNLYCSFDDVYQYFRTYTCHNPGTVSSYCTHSENPEMKIDCGEDSCDSWGSWYCSDSTHRNRDRTCYDKGCSSGGCFNNRWTDTQSEVCPTGYVCEHGQCILSPALTLTHSPSIAKVGGYHTYTVTHAPANSDIEVWFSLDNGSWIPCENPGPVIGRTDSNGYYTRTFGPLPTGTEGHYEVYAVIGNKVTNTINFDIIAETTVTAPVLSHFPSVVQAGKNHSYSVTNAAPDSDIEVWYRLNNGPWQPCYDPGFVIGKTNSKGLFYGSFGPVTNDHVGSYEVYAVVAGKKSNPVTFEIVASGGLLL